MKKRIPELDFIKGAAIILVVIGHVISQVWNSNPAIYENVFLFRICYSFHMPLFVFVSGWICRLTIKSDIQWLSKRIHHIGVPYILMTLLVFFLLRNGSISQFIADSPYWYLLFVIVADSILFLGIKLRLVTITFGAAYVIILLLNWQIPQNIGILRQLADFLPFYAAGTLMPKITKKAAKLTIPALMSLGVLYIAIFPLYRHGISNQLKYIKYIFNTEKLSLVVSLCIIGINKFILPACGIALVFLITKAIYCTDITEIFRKSLEITGNHTLMIYLLHDLFFVRITGNPLANSVISIFTAFFIPFSISAAYNVLKRKSRNYNLSK